MRPIDALHGRTRVRRAQSRRRQIVLLLFLAMAVLALEQLARIDVFGAAAGRGRSPQQLLLAQTLALALGPAIGGVLADAIGVRRVVGLCLIGWCALVTLGTQTDPSTFADLAPIATNLLPGMLFASALKAARRSLATRRRGPTIALLVLAFNALWPTRYPIDLYVQLFGQPAVGNPTGWQFPMFVLASAGAALTAIWLMAFPETDAGAGLDLRPAERRSLGDRLSEAARMVGDPTVWSLVAIQYGAAFVNLQALDQTWTVDMAREGAVKTSVLLTIVVIPVAYLVAATWSDWAYRRTRSFLSARRPFIVIGFLAAAAAPLASIAPERSRLAATLVVATGIGALRLADLVMVDLAPRRSAGTYIGTILTGEIAVAIAINWFLLRPDALPADVRLAVVSGIALLGAVLAAITLPLMRPHDDAKAAEDQRPADYF